MDEKQKDVEVKTEEITIPNISPVDECIDYGQDILTTQLGFVKDKNYDFAPEFRDMTTQLYMIGVMWKHAEGLEHVQDPRETAFNAMEAMLIRDGMKPKEVGKRIEFLRKMSRVEDGSNALAVAVGYNSHPDDQSLVEVFEHYVDDIQVSGAFWRLYDRGKKTMLYGGLFVAFVVIWFVTLFMPGNSTIAILAAGLISAALFVIPVFLIGLLIYHLKIKKTKQST
ncbi:hypothetical protein [Nitrosomonas sp.]|uniref:hypothetical protein n=1 Tax=Nitrosomonas sp. TaxID=42353 RepID=UPI001D9DFDC3|nr:hypothetical protein [Nitrosomonas sp.]MCB1948357.1 hypothetical protein [Nitrosomonas sp.]MCP5244284.1 hypothetical protein [Burkholderiales bacterium]MDR4514967.1 hypothetical protein [Nitrosomonas sp.]